MSSAVITFADFFLDDAGFVGAGGGDFTATRSPVAVDRVVRNVGSPVGLVTGAGGAIGAEAGAGARRNPIVGAGGLGAPVGFGGSGGGGGVRTGSVTRGAAGLLYGEGAGLATGAGAASTVGGAASGLRRRGNGIGRFITHTPDICDRTR